MSKRRSSLALEAARISRRQKDDAILQKEFSDGGWKLLDDSRTVTRRASMSEFFSHPIHDLPRYATKYEIFVALLPPAFLNDV